ncbi:MAG: 50S ribosomal protein L6 [Clostridia bacterium]|nr:50S ribosomal protein L6 [Clostridia bacterium]
MSRIGNALINIPAGVTVEIKDGVLTVKGPKGTLTREYDTIITPVVEGNVLKFTRANDLGPTKAKHGLYRALAFNMVKGVTEGYTKNLIVNGVGWKVNKQGNKLVMNVGFSHPVEFLDVEGITIECPSVTEISVKGIDKELVGKVAAKIRSIREPEPYHGYGIRYSDEVIERKVGKAAGGKG